MRLLEAAVHQNRPTLPERQDQCLGQLPLAVSGGEGEELLVLQFAAGAIPAMDAELSQDLLVIAVPGI